ncbi:MAG: 5-formyltetrahydrofolate cyclo-ligase [Emcibacter sp.]|nr:5-formyltetrahydrofolate cyclo-ligase [Emcibacter sp.]
MKQKKTALRQEMKVVRQQIHDRHIQEQNDMMAVRQMTSGLLMLPEIAGEVQRGIKARRGEPHIVAGFSAIQTEIDCLFILKALSAIQCRCALPVIKDKNQPLIFREWDLAEDLVDSHFGTMEPGANCSDVMPDIILVPMLAFDETGHRLGYGGGYYDRTLEYYRNKGHAFTAIGIAFEGQKRDQIPVADYDQPLDIIVTEQKVYRP